MFCKAKASTSRISSENRKVWEDSDTSVMDLMNRSTNSENCSMDPDTSHSSTSRRFFCRFFR